MTLSTRSQANFEWRWTAARVSCVLWTGLVTGVFILMTVEEAHTWARGLTTLKQFVASLVYRSYIF